MPDVCRDEQDAGRAGIVDATAPALPRVARVALLHQRKELASFDVGMPPQPVRDIRPLEAAAGPDPVRGAAPADPVLTWADDVRERAAATGPAPGGSPRLPTYTVQVSTDDRRTWRTIGLGLRQPRVTIDRNLLRGADRLSVRVTSTDGVHSASQERSFRARDLFVAPAPEEKPGTAPQRLKAFLIEKSGALRDRVREFIEKETFVLLPSVSGGGKSGIAPTLPIPASRLSGTGTTSWTPGRLDEGARLVSPTHPDFISQGVVRLDEGRVRIDNARLPIDEWVLLGVVSGQGAAPPPHENLLALHRPQAAGTDAPSDPSDYATPMAQGHLLDAWDAV
ncbi:MAG TPA: hypothetical protein VKG78_11575 [Opitutaceae bacterium]|nr:hypothetical protein [Opitutaceae bacterium]